MKIKAKQQRNRQTKEFMSSKTFLYSNGGKEGGEIVA